MITKLTLNNFKSISKQTFRQMFVEQKLLPKNEFSQFDLLVGQNNSGKSTILQALAIWQFCIDEFSRAKHRKNKSIQIVLPHFTVIVKCQS
jgi:AAA15 family ATPase/GTPase